MVEKELKYDIFGALLRFFRSTRFCPLVKMFMVDDSVSLTFSDVLQNVSMKGSPLEIGEDKQKNLFLKVFLEIFHKYEERYCQTI